MESNTLVTSRIPVEIPVTQGSMGNFFALTDAINKELDPCDYIYGVEVIGNIPGMKWEHTSTTIPGVKNTDAGSTKRLSLFGAKDKQLMIQYDTCTGDYEVAINDFSVNEIPTLRLMVSRHNPNRRPIGKKV